MKELHATTAVIQGGDDEWYDRSITDYKELMMLEMENVPLLLSVGGPDNLFILERKDERRQVLSNFQLPDTIIESRQNEVVKSSHMKINAGAFITYDLKQINSLYGQKCALASGVNLSGLSVYRMSTDSDRIVKDCERLFEGSLMEPRFCQVDETTQILSKTVDDPVYSCDMGSDSIKQLNLSKSSPDRGSNLIPFAVSNRSLALGSENSGNVVIYDFPTEGPVMTLLGHAAGAKYRIASSYKAIPGHPSSTIIASTSEHGSVAVYDLRAPNRPLSTGKATVESANKICVSPDEKYISISDKTGKVRIYSYSPEGICEKFVHEGHVRMEHCNTSAECIDHVWYSQSTLISCATNKSINIWQPNLRA
ncbi:Hypothetical protein NTJ_05399 [Nesidiocoris tenuis]|uniref:WD repeat-containing protein 55 homolog n=1 Tax=Nesidiocoris tenuis TaxID=355587 RepID=A0ABN7AK05_9HEMI|nr:Hypothetical protein NTJ_05399 [Nesidiocoris tenuis]